jgi:Holliday junction DNA helicase RuvA
MISFIKGPIVTKTPTAVEIEAGGLGYDINISLNTYTQIEALKEVKLHTYLHVKEDSHTLYGFFEPIERFMFKHLISVSGVGPNTARVVLSSMTAEETRMAIISNNVAAFKKVKGIGPKSAQRIILDLKDKLIKDGGQNPKSSILVSNTLLDEALSALLALGFNKAKASKVLMNILSKSEANVPVEELIKGALKQLT